ncbi:MAG: hypothetical protein E7439_01985 [Ruminococcaceae bacterium]|nr:hypothetical protein [Oscillospiraceae bacterium]
MSYRIEYGTSGDRRKPILRKKTVAAITAAALVFVLIAGALTVKIVGLTWVQEVLLPGDPAVTAAALENLAADLQSGEPLLEAITAFCREIIRHAP